MRSAWNFGGGAAGGADFATAVSDVGNWGGVGGGAQAEDGLAGAEDGAGDAGRVGFGAGRADDVGLRGRENCVLFVSISKL